MSLLDWPYTPLDLTIVRARAKQRPLRPFVLFCTKSALKLALEGTGIDHEEIAKRGNEFRPGLWHFTIATHLDGTEQRRALGLVSISNASTVARQPVGAGRNAGTCTDDGTGNRADHFCGANCRCAVVDRSNRGKDELTSPA
jgi:hypothetical protein